MKKHIAGLVIFSFIIVAAAIAHAIFNVSKAIPISVISQNDSISKPTACWNMKRKSNESNTDSPTITQAVYNVKTRKLSWKLSSLKAEKPTVIRLFSVDEKGAKQIDSFYAEELLGFEKVNFSLETNHILSKVSSETNLYLIADTKWNQVLTDEARGQNEFDSTKGFPVTIDYGK